MSDEDEQLFKSLLDAIDTGNEAPMNHQEEASEELHASDSGYQVSYFSDESVDHESYQDEEVPRRSASSNAPPLYNIQLTGEELRKYISKRCKHTIKRMEFREGGNKDGDKILSHDLFNRYRALFTLREINTKETVLAICKPLKAENNGTCSALLKHEVAFVLAQMDTVNEHSTPFLLECINNEDEAPIARHEALIAIAQILDGKS